jgi:hypothetical protein
MSLSEEARRTLPFLETYEEAPPIGRGYWELTASGIVHRILPLRLTSPQGLGLKRTPRFWIYSPISQERLRRARLWYDPQKATPDQLDLWIKPYRAREELVAITSPIEPAEYSLAQNRMWTTEFTIMPELGRNIDRVIVRMNTLPYQGTWRSAQVEGERLIVVERGVRPTIVVKPITATLHGLLAEGFDIEQVQQTASIIVRMLSSNFPDMVRTLRKSSSIPPEIIARITEP